MSSPTGDVTGNQILLWRSQHTQTLHSGLIAHVLQDLKKSPGHNGGIVMIPVMLLRSLTLKDSFFRLG